LPNPLQDGDFTGQVEAEWILNEMKALVGGYAFETRAPDDTQLPRDTSGKTLPYIIVRFSQPFSSAQGRNIGREWGQPHLLSFTILVISGDADWTRQMMAKVMRTLLGQNASNTSSDIEATGGFSYGQGEAGSVPSRFELAQFFRMTINV